jgi:PAS domain S-box-containing protein
VETRRFVVGEQIRGPITGQPTIMFAHPVLDGDGTVRGVVAAGLDLGWLSRIGPRVSLSPESSLLVLDANGVVLTRHPDPEKWTGQHVPATPLVQAIRERRGEGTAETTGLDGIPRLFAFTRVATEVADSTMYVAVGIPKAKVTREVTRQLTRSLLLVSLMAALAIGVAWVGAHWLVLTPVRRLLATTQRLARGDLSARTGLVGVVGDLAALARAYDDMALALESHERKLSATHEDLERSLERFELFVQGVKGYALFMLDGEGRVATWNAGAYALIGCDQSDIVGRHFSDLFGADAAKADLPGEMMEALQRQTVAERECRLRRVRAGEFWASIQLSALRNAEGTLRGYACLVRDMTELKQAQQEQRALARRVISAQEDERRRVARELHDEIGQLLTALKLTMQALPHLSPAELATRVASGLAAVDRAIAEVRTLSMELRPLVLDDLGLSAAIRFHVDRRCKEAGLQAHVHTELPGDRPAAEIETAAYRIVQEALTNILRHAQARQVWIDVVRTEVSLVLKVRDDGNGFDPSAQARGRPVSMGLSSMRERAILVGGELGIDTAVGVGTVVRATLPLSMPASGAVGTTS